VERVDAELLHRVYAALGLEPARVRDAAWLTNGPRQLTLLVDSAETVLAVKPDHPLLAHCEMVGLVGAWPAGGESDFEVRLFAYDMGVPEDPVTGSLNANIACWLIDSGRAPAAYTATQGRVIGRAGRIHVRRDAKGTWIGGDVAACVDGTVML
jgi:PhzF family phenazine biosynthesis protein